MADERGRWEAIRERSSLGRRRRGEVGFASSVGVDVMVEESRGCILGDCVDDGASRGMATESAERESYCQAYGLVKESQWCAVMKEKEREKKEKRREEKRGVMRDSVRGSGLCLINPDPKVMSASGTDTHTHTHTTGIRVEACDDVVVSCPGTCSNLPSYGTGGIVTRSLDIFVAQSFEPGR
jgi:hypothetical protein